MKLELPKLDLAQLDALKDAIRRVLTAPEHRRALLAGAAAVLVVGVWYFTFAQPIAARVAAFRARHEGAQRQLLRLQSPAAVVEVKARVTTLEGRVRAAFGRMSQDVQLVQILKQLSVHAARYQIAVENIDMKAVEGGATPAAAPPKPREASREKPEPEKPAKPLEIRTQRLELTLACSYEAAARFVDDLKTLPAFVIIDGLKLDRDASTFPNLKVLLALKIHSLKQLPEELAKI